MPLKLIDEDGDDDDDERAREVRATEIRARQRAMAPIIQRYRDCSVSNGTLSLSHTHTRAPHYSNLTMVIL